MESKITVGDYISPISMLRDDQDALDNAFSYLRKVINDPSVSTELRMQAALAILGNAHLIPETSKFNIIKDSND